MKRSLLITMSILALSISFHGARSVSAQSVPIAGGYTRTSNSSPEIVSAARHAARELNLKKGDLFFVDSVKSAEVQVVAGRNYRLVMTVWVGGKLQNFKVVVHKNLDDEYSLSRLASLDARRPYLGRVRIVIEHSLAADGDKGQYESRTFRTLAQADRWLKSREIQDGVPARETRPLYDCGGGSCEFDLNGGILHNHLYLTKVTYVIRRGRPYIKTIYLLDGD